MTFFAADGSGRHVPSYNQPPFFPSTQPRPPEAAPKGRGCVSANNHTHNNTGLSGIPAAKARFRQAANHRKALYSSRFSGFYLLFTFVIKTTHSTWLEPLGLMSWADFLHLTFTGTYQWIFGIRQKKMNKIDITLGVQYSIFPILVLPSHMSIPKPQDHLQCFHWVKSAGQSLTLFLSSPMDNYLKNLPLFVQIKGHSHKS